LRKKIRADDIDESIKLNILNLFTAIVYAWNEDYYKAVKNRNYERIKEIEEWYRSEDFKFFTLYQADSEEYIKFIRKNYKLFKKTTGKMISI
jgi:hypothetical protein